MQFVKMKVIYLLTAIFGAVLCGPVPDTGSQDDVGLNMKFLLVETADGRLEIEDLVNSEIDTRTSETDVTYEFFSKSNPNSGVKVKSNAISSLKNTNFKVSKDTLFIVHGWRNDNESPVNYEVKTAVLSRYDVNVFVVDWSPLAGKNYVSARNAVAPVGKYLAGFIQEMVSKYGLKLSKVALVGHSLGAHVSGNAGAALKGQLKHIVGLDPAYPLFTYNNVDNRLDPTDAKFVEIIHTNGGLLGFSASIGHVDYFPNGGSRQPGCGVDATGSCAHSRSYQYYAESVKSSNNLFVSRSCSSYKEYTKGRCGSNAASLMGGYAIDTKAKGNYYLNTNSATPYAKG